MQPRGDQPLPFCPEKKKSPFPTGFLAQPGRRLTILIHSQANLKKYFDIIPTQ